MPPMNTQWRSLRQLADDPAFIARAAQEFPALAEQLAAPVDRRRVLQLMAASFAMAGLSGCDIAQPPGELIPAVRIPPDIIPSLPNYYTTANVIDGYASGVVVKHWMGRPIKVEGNPHHPASLGATDAFGQAMVLDFYDPHRRAALIVDGVPAQRQQLLTALVGQRGQIAATHGAGFRILTGTVTSPTLARQIDALLAQYPEARWHQWEPVSRDAVRKGAVLAYGKPVAIVPHLDRADVILALDSDLISSAPGHLRAARDFASRRNPTRTQRMSRVYAVEPTPTLIGTAADHRFIAGPREMHEIVTALSAALLTGATPGHAPDWVGAVASDLKAAHGRAFVHVGPDQPAETHALVHAMNEALGGRGATFDLIDPVEHGPTDQAASLAALVEDMRAGRVTALLMIDINPVYAAPAPLGFTEALRHVPFNLALSRAPDETARAATWFVPMAHPWEAWGDARAFDGTATIMQPQALPLYGGTSPSELLSLFADATGVPSRDSVEATWKPRFGERFADAWYEALASGVVANTASGKADTTLRSDVARLAPPKPPDQAVTVLFRPDPHVWDGRFADNPWLLELPRPLTKLTWDNPLLIAPALAGKLGVANGDRVHLSIGQAEMTAPVWLLPGQAQDCVLAPLGFGRTELGPVAQGAGFDFYRLTGWSGAVQLRKAGGTDRLASTEHHALIFDDAGEFVRNGALEAFQADPRFLHDDHAQPHLYRTHPPGPAAWAMSIDLNSCIGCNACVVACQAENNIPVVGKEEVLREREMHWLRIDRYYQGNPDAPETFFQPILCMHCEQAPCEIVCPVGATVHDSEGLNVMVYNRCVGTRFCSNNCPYKVRRFNYFAFADKQDRPPESWNPDVTVRARGVMEKCTFCLQRIAAARIERDKTGGPTPEVRTACQAACPTQAFTFGNLADEDSEVSKRKQSPLDYALLEDQNTNPRVTFEGRILNLNPALERASS
ncbi:MAG: TAT-variant-translocated molybdopterin oxidoreductase [Alphaproteobacteria bacterium]|nr:TAT-variant-translocated molybdopterin oxidoreductase [Alphaproteobacteria bacterium]